MEAIETVIVLEDGHPNIPSPPGSHTSQENAIPRCGTPPAQEAIPVKRKRASINRGLVVEERTHGQGGADRGHSQRGQSSILTLTNSPRSPYRE